MTEDEAIRILISGATIGHSPWDEARDLAIKALEFKRDHKCKAKIDEWFIKWITNKMIRTDKRPARRLCAEILSLLDTSECRHPWPTGFGAEF